jgi:hypothetical protein
MHAHKDGQTDSYNSLCSAIVLKWSYLWREYTKVISYVGARPKEAVERGESGERERERWRDERIERTGRKCACSIKVISLEERVGEEPRTV